jgi:hypothetical protein
MSLNRYEQAVFDYWDRALDERRHWQGRVVELTRGGANPMLARALERELAAYVRERSEHVPALRDLRSQAGERISLLNLADYLLRLWGPPPKPKKPAAPP